MCVTCELPVQNFRFPFLLPHPHPLHGNAKFLRCGHLWEKFVGAWSRHPAAEILPHSSILEHSRWVFGSSYLLGQLAASSGFHSGWGGWQKTGKLKCRNGPVWAITGHTSRRCNITRSHRVSGLSLDAFSSAVPPWFWVCINRATHYQVSLHNLTLEYSLEIDNSTPI
jgi:hypothetical protein